MRVISQNGTIDVPYENFVFSILNSSGGNYGIVAVKNVAEPPEFFMNSLIATYSTKEKAIKAMEMLRTSYKRNLAMGLMLEKARRVFANAESSMSNMEIMVDISEELTEFEYFQFPQDDEIEV